MGSVGCFWAHGKGNAYSQKTPDSALAHRPTCSQRIACGWSPTSCEAEATVALWVNRLNARPLRCPACPLA
eukprot:8525191-Alexandrium_andersonii.AAC.1